MAKLDRLGWAEGFAFDCHGARLGFRVNDPAVLERVCAYLPPGWKPAASPIVDTLYSLIVGGDVPNSRVRRFHLLYAGAARMARTMDLDQLLDTLESDLHFRVAVGAQRQLFVHAGVVGWHGRAIVIPGVSMSGKTTLVEALIRAGATYYSDEFAAFDSLGRVHPYPRPLHIRGADGEPRRRLPANALGGRAGTKPLPVGLVALTEYRPGARWRPRELSPGESVLELLGHTVLARYRPRLALKTLRHVASGAVTLRGKRGEANETAAALLERTTVSDRAPGEGRRGRSAILVT